MKKILNEYGGVAVTMVAVVCLMGMVALLMSPGGVLDRAFRNIAWTIEVNAGDLIVNGSVGSGSPGSGGGATEVVWPDVDWETVDWPADTETMIYQVENLDSSIRYQDFTVEYGTRNKIGFTGAENEKLYIPVAFQDGDGTWYKVTAIGNSAFNAHINGEDVDDICINLQSVAIPATVASIGEYAFYGCVNLQSVKLDKTSQLETIGVEAFYGCIRLRSVNIPDSVTTIGEYAFYGCTGLEAVGFDKTSRLENILTNAFYGCSSLKSIAIPGNGTTVGTYAFNDSGLQSLIIGSGVATIGEGAFSGCAGLQSVVFESNSQLNALGVNAFSNCSSLQSICIPGSVTSIGAYSFEGCGLKTLTFADGVEVLEEGAFYGCGNLQSVTIPSSMTTIGSSVFADCSALTTVYYGGTEEAWANVNIHGYRNTYLTGATIHYS